MANLTNNNKLIDEINSKLKQVNVMPTANVSNVGKVIQYIGPDDDVNNFFNGHFYRCISDGQDPATYSWEEIILGVTSYNDLTDVPVLVTSQGDKYCAYSLEDQGQSVIVYSHLVEAENDSHVFFDFGEGLFDYTQMMEEESGGQYGIKFVVDDSGTHVVMSQEGTIVQDYVAERIPGSDRYDGGSTTYNPNYSEVFKLSGLLDTNFNSYYPLAEGDMVVFDGDAWINAPMDQLIIRSYNDLENKLKAGQNTTITMDTSDNSPVIDVAVKAGKNVSIVVDDTNTQVISAKDTDTTYTAGAHIEIVDGSPHSAQKGPCPDGYHVPSAEEWNDVFEGLGNNDNVTTRYQLMIGKTGNIYANETYGGEANGRGRSDGVNLWTADTTVSSLGNILAFYAYLHDNTGGASGMVKSTIRLSDGHPIRAFKNEAVIPDETWQVRKEGKAWWNPERGLITVLGASGEYRTMQDKNLGATRVWDGTDNSETDGAYFQRGNCYPFPYENQPVFAEKIDVSEYGPGNRYTSSYFRTSTPWFTEDSEYADLWGGETNYAKNVINAIIPEGIKSYDELRDKLIAGDNITIKDESTGEMQGPCDEGFHVPSAQEREAIINAGLTQDQFKTYLHIPFAGYRGIDAGGRFSEGTNGFLWSCSPSEFWVRALVLSDSSVEVMDRQYRSYGFNVRAFRDFAIKPDSSWTETIEGKVWYNSELGLITVCVADDSYVTMQDKNVGATTIYNDGDTLTNSNRGKYFQRGNNYGFEWGATGDTSSVLVDASSYGPSEYSSNVFIVTTSGPVYDWSSVQNDNLWGRYGMRPQHNVISAHLNVNDLTDVEVTNIQDGDTLIRDGESNKFVNVSGCCDGGVKSYDDLTDKLIAGENITIGDKCATSGTVTGPCDNGFHIPTKAEWDSVIALNLTSAQVVSALHIPYGGIRRHNDGSFDYVRSEARFWVSNAITGSGDIMNNYYAYISQYATAVVSSNTIALGCNIRAFKNTPVVPDATWTETVTGKVREKDGLISILVDTDTYVTMQDKNVGATTVWNTGDTVSSENVGDYFQWGNNHGFKLNSTGDTSSTQVDASSYGPGEYDSDTFVIGQIDWMSVDNYDLWGAETGCAVEHNVISANVSDASKDSDIAFATITLSGTSVVFTNSFITTNTLVSYTILNGASPLGIVSASVSNGFVTFESTASENLQFYVKFEKNNNNSTILVDNG